MPIEPVVCVVAALLIFGAGLGTREAVRWVLGELAFTRAVQGELDGFFARYREHTGRNVGLIDDVPPHMASPGWVRDEPQEPGEYRPEPKPGDPELPDDGEEAHPRDAARLEFGAWRRETVRGDGQMAAWPTNRPPGQHRDDQETRDLSVYAAAFHDIPEVAAP